MRRGILRSLLCSCALLAPGAAPVLDAQVTVLSSFESPADRYSVDVKHEIAAEADWVKDGTQGLRFFVDSARSEGGVAFTELPEGTYDELAFWVLNPGSDDRRVSVRVDDRRSSEGPKWFTTRTVKPGWTEVVIDLSDLRIAATGRRVDPSRLTRLHIYVFRPKESFPLGLDHVRLRTFGAEDPPADQAGREIGRLSASKADADRVQAVLQMRFLPESERLRRALDAAFPAVEDVRIFNAAAAVLGTLRTGDAVAQLIARYGKLRGADRFRMLDVLGRVRHADATAFVRDRAVEGGSAERTAAVRALGRFGDPDITDLITGKAAEGTWQVRSAVVDVLEIIGGKEAIGGLIEMLRTETSERVRADEVRLLGTMTGNDLGADAKAWAEWWAVAGQKPLSELRRGRAGRYGGHASYYGVPITGGRLVFLLDISGSMNAELKEPKTLEYIRKTSHLRDRNIRTRLDLAKLELAHAIEGLPEKTLFEVIYFNDGVNRLNREGLVPADRSNRDRVIKRVLNLGGGDATNIHGALTTAFHLEKDPASDFDRSVDTIFLLTDGYPSAGSIRNAAHLADDIADRNRSRSIRIHAINVGEADPRLLRRLAEESGGEFVNFGVKD